MLTIPGYHITEKIYTGRASTIYRGTRQEDRQAVILKRLNQEYPSPEEYGRFLQEYELTRELKAEGIIQVYSLEKHGALQLMILEDILGTSLDIQLKTEPFSISEFLQTAIALTKALGSIHQQHVIHKAITPANIIINRRTQKIRIIDFGCASRFSKDTHTLRNPYHPEVDLGYISPEQTGRMNRTIDYRTDFYSLGITFYEMLLGDPPFQSTDPLELVHCHIAKPPPPPRHDVPQTVFEIIMKLLAKTPEDRYQSIVGLRLDLEACLSEWQVAQMISPFTLGQHDISSRFQIPEKLYGRDAETAKLLEIFDRVTKGSTEVAFVSGQSGVGKSTLVHEIYKPVVRQRGYFVTGKYGQIRPNIPYGPIIQAFRELVRQVLMENEEQVLAWKREFTQTLGANAQVIIQVIPEVEQLLGKPLPVPELSPVETQNRFHRMFQNFIRLFARPEHPLVLFLDDLQWIDAASLSLLQRLLNTAELRCLLLIGSYREHEITPQHPLKRAIEELHHDGIPVEHLHLEPLEFQQVMQWVDDTLHCPSYHSRHLAELIFHKTQGNAFFMVQFFQALYDEQLLVFNETHGRWDWELEKIHEKALTDNVVDLLAEKIQKYPAATQNVLKWASCIGNVFDLETLSLLHEQSWIETATDLWDALWDGLIVTEAGSNAWELKGGPTGPYTQALAYPIPSQIPRFKFLHDRVQQAVYTLIPEELLQNNYLKIGRVLWAHLSPEVLQTRIFEVVNPYNRGLVLVRDAQEKKLLAKLNLTAGKKAKVSAAYASAYRYLQIGLGLLDDACWETDYSLTLELYLETSELAYICGYFAQMRRLNIVILKKAKTLLDKIRAHELQIKGDRTENKLLRSIHATLIVLRQLNIKLPDAPRSLHIALGLLKTRFLLRGTTPEDLTKLPDMEHPEKLAAMRMLGSAGFSAYITLPKLLPLIVFQSIRLSLRYGSAALTPFTFAGYGLLLCAKGDIDQGYRYGELALTLKERPNAKVSKARTWFVVASMIRHWKRPIRESLPAFLAIYHEALETGDVEFAALAIELYCEYSFIAGVPLGETESEMLGYRKTIQQFKQETVLNFNAIHRQSALNLLGQAKDPCRLIGAAYDEEQMLPRHLEEHDETALVDLYLHKVILYFLFEDYTNAVAYAQASEQHLMGIIGTAGYPLHHFYASLSRLGIMPTVSPSEKKRLLKQVQQSQKQLRKWAHHAPMNYQHKCDLVAAEHARIFGETATAMALYTQAIQGAKNHGFLHEEALANILAAKFYHALGQEAIAKIYMREGYYLCQGWGALACIKHLELRYPRLVPQSSLPAETQQKTATAHYTQTTVSSTTEAMDLNAVIKASQALSEEIQLEVLLKKMMKIVVEHAGAEKGLLLLKAPYDEELLIQAAYFPDTRKSQVLQGIPVSQSGQLPLNIIRYVHRTKSPIVLSNASSEGLFTQDDYILRARPKSILCAPVSYHGKLTGLVYLENNLIFGAFTSQRLEILDILTAQSAISIENAMLYSRLEEQERMKLELKTAQVVHEMLIPKTDPVLEGIEISSYYQSASEIGGDWYRFRHHPDIGTFEVVIGDVTGHGVAAALITAVADSVYDAIDKQRIRASQFGVDESYMLHPTYFLGLLNSMLYSMSKGAYSMTLFYAVIDLKHKIMIYTSAAHNPIFVWRPSGFMLASAPGKPPLKREIISLMIRSPGLGHEPENHFEIQTLELAVGDVIIWYTDGLIENMNAAGEMFERHRLKQLLRSCGGLSAHEIREKLVQAAIAHYGHEPLEDDITLIVGRVK